MILKKWNYDKHEYEPYRVPKEWNCSCYSDDLQKIINCCQCGKETVYGYSFTSQEVHLHGFAWMVCKECHEVEMKRRFREDD
jgi:hypothetical protein